MNCHQCEEQLSDYLENTQSFEARGLVDEHLQACLGCRQLAADMEELLGMKAEFPDYSPPDWLAPRILLNTPRLARETWRDTAEAMLRWLAEPRLAMIVFTATIVLGWMGSVAGLTPASVVRVVREPAILYYEAGTRLNRAYGSAVRTYYSTPLVTEIQSQIERLREIS